MNRTLVVVYNIAQVVATAVVCFAHAHRVVGEVDIAVVAEDCTESCALVDGGLSIFCDWGFAYTSAS